MEAEAVELELPRPWPQHIERQGRYVDLEPLNVHRHANALFSCSHADEAARRIWTYLPYGPFADQHAMAHWLAQAASRPDPQFYTIVDKASRSPMGVCTLMRIEPQNGTIEVGHIWYGPALQRTSGATEAMFLLFSHVFDDLRYRRLEWKCNAMNAASRRAAERLGFTFEGIFRQHLVVKGRNRDSAWFSLLDREWAAVRAGMSTWLAPENQPSVGLSGQARALADCIADHRS